MPNIWDEASRGIDRKFRRLTGRMTITIYGSYEPPAELAFLNRQKAFLRSAGYADTGLVTDRSAGGLDPLKASKICLRSSDVNFLFFTKEGRKLGVVRELAYVAESEDMASKVQDCVVFYQRDGAVESIPALSRSDIDNASVPARPFSSEADLREAMQTRALWYLRRKRGELEGRHGR